MRWVRPDLTTDLNSRDFLRSTRARWARAGINRCWISVAAATWMADGKTSLEDWEALTSSFGCTVWPSRSVARVARTSFMFMLVEVPDPVWYTSMGKLSAH